MEEFVAVLLKNYGLAGGLFVSVLGFSGYIIHTILKHFIKASDRKDKDLSFVYERSARAIENNTKALSELNRTQQKLSSIMNNILDNFHLLRDKNSDEHRAILAFIEDQTRV